MAGGAIDSEYRLANESTLTSFVATVLRTVGVSATDATTVAEILVTADLRGIESHGVARLETFYVGRLRKGQMIAADVSKTVRETASSVLVDAGNGLGHPAGKRTMERVIEKAVAHGSAFGAVRNSNHFGIAGYYVMMALEHDLIGIASTNSVRYGAPTFGRDIMLGTNPLAFAIPAQNEPAFVLDFATTTVPRGKLEVYNRKELPLKPGWAIDANGVETLDATVALDGALLPLGGFGTEGGGHKGYGLGLLVDLLCGVLAGGAFATALPLPNDPPQPGRVSHFFGAFRIDGFREVDEFKRDVDRALREFKDSAKTPGADRIYVAGEIEYEKTLDNREHGVPLHVKVWNALEKLADELAMPFDIAKR